MHQNSTPHRPPAGACRRTLPPTCRRVPHARGMPPSSGHCSSAGCSKHPPVGPQAGLLVDLIVHGAALELEIERGRVDASRPEGLVGLVQLVAPARGHEERSGDWWEKVAEDGCRREGLAKEMTSDWRASVSTQGCCGSPAGVTSLMGCLCGHAARRGYVGEPTWCYHRGHK